MSNKFALLPGEQVVKSSEDDVLVLTNKRIRYSSVVWGQSNLISIPLATVASCGLVTRSYPLLLVIAALAIFAAFTQHGSFQIGAFVLAAILIAAYFKTRRSVLSITSYGGDAILAPIEGMSRDVIVGFIDDLERLKLQNAHQRGQVLH